MCDRHHHDIHDGGWTLTMTPDRVLTLTAPDGSLRFHGDTRDRVTRPLPPIDHDVGPPDDHSDHDDGRTATITSLGSTLHRYRHDHGTFTATATTGTIDRHGP